MRKFDDYTRRQINERVQLCLRSNAEISLSAWELSNFLSNFSSYYYKIEILDTLSNALYNGIKPHNIIILDESFKLNKSYKNFNCIDLNDSLHELYYIGKPISFYPNDNIEEIYLLFKYFRLINEYLFKVKSQRLNAESIASFYLKINDIGLVETMRIILDDAKKNIDNKDNRGYIDKLRENFIREFGEYQKASISFSSIEDNFDKIMLLDENEEDKYKGIISKYYKRFANYLIRLPRPLIGIYYHETGTFEVLARAHVNKTERNLTHLDIKEITHNSPIKTLIEAGASIYSTIKDEGRKNEIHELQKEKLRYEIECEQRKLQLIQKKIDTLEKFENYNTGTEERIKQIPYTYVGNQMLISYSKVQASTHKLLQDNDMSIDYENTFNIEV